MTKISPPVHIGLTLMYYFVLAGFLVSLLTMFGWIAIAYLFPVNQSKD